MHLRIGTRSSVRWKEAEESLVAGRKGAGKKTVIFRGQRLGGVRSGWPLARFAFIIPFGRARVRVRLEKSRIQAGARAWYSASRNIKRFMGLSGVRARPWWRGALGPFRGDSAGEAGSLRPSGRTGSRALRGPVRCCP